MSIITIQYKKDSIRMVRLSHNLSQTDLARKAGFNRQNIMLWESGTIPGADKLARIASAIGLKSIDVFFDISYASTNSSDANGNEDTVDHTDKIDAA